MQIVSHGKHNLMLGMDELLALVLVTHLDVTLLGPFLPNSAGGTKGRDSSSYTTPNNQPCALQCNALVLVLHLQCNNSVPLLYSRWSLGTTELREVATETDFYNNRGSSTWYVVNKEPRPDGVAQEVCVVGI